jgi:hypothetical protein
VQRQRFTSGLAELRAMAATPCTATQFRGYIEGVFADQLSGTINDKRGDRSSARARQVEDLPAWESLENKFHGRTIGSDIPGVKGSVWGAYQAVTEFLSHDAGRAKDPTEAARQLLESLYWGQGAQMLTRAHELALSATRA